MFPSCHIRLIAGLLALLLLTCTACAGNSDGAETTDEPSTTTEAVGDPTDTTNYEAMILQLQQTLLEERENRYISEADYRARLELLEAELEALRSTQSGSSGNKPGTSPSQPEAETKVDLPTSGQPDPAPDQGTSSVSFSYSVTDGRVTIHEYLGQATAVILPETVDGYPVTAIADNAFKNSSVTSVVIPSTVTDIGWFAFYGCISLDSVTVPASVSMIHYAAFDACPKLTVLCPKDSYAAQYVASFGLRCEFI